MLFFLVAFRIWCFYIYIYVQIKPKDKAVVLQKYDIWHNEQNVKINTGYDTRNVLS